MTYVAILANSVGRFQNAPTLYIYTLIWVHTACKKATVYFGKQRQIYIEKHGSVVERVTRVRLHVCILASRLPHDISVYLCVYSSVCICAYVRVCLSVCLQADRRSSCTAGCRHVHTHTSILNTHTTCMKTEGQTIEQTHRQLRGCLLATTLTYVRTYVRVYIRAPARTYTRMCGRTHANIHILKLAVTYMYAEVQLQKKNKKTKKKRNYCGREFHE